MAPLYANYGPGSVVIPEFGSANAPDGREAFDKRKPVTITVKASGAAQKKKPSAAGGKKKRTSAKL